MFLTKKNSTIVSVFTLAECSTLTNPTYLFRLISDESGCETTFIAADTSAYPSRFNEFAITENDTNPNRLAGEFSFRDAGFYNYEIYEQTDTENLDWELADNLLETGKMRLLFNGDLQEDTYTEYTPDKECVIYYNKRPIVTTCGIGCMEIENNFIVG